MKTPPVCKSSRSQQNQQLHHTSVVSWNQNSFPLQPTDRRTMSSRGNRHTLTIRHVQQEDFGNYSCVADNSLGRSKKYMEVSGRPGPADFLSPPWSRSTDSFNLTWKVESYPPLQEVRLLYRKLMMNETFQQPGRWHDVILTPAPRPPSEPLTHVMAFTLRGLQHSSVDGLIEKFYPATSNKPGRWVSPSAAAQLGRHNADSKRQCCTSCRPSPTPSQATKQATANDNQLTSAASTACFAVSNWIVKSTTKVRTFTVDDGDAEESRGASKVHEPFFLFNDLEMQAVAAAGRFEKHQGKCKEECKEDLREWHYSNS
uniref:Ig-like domain-containing protein n=1 Tax=Anopheles farauti TaxID=69004 RepID=A0A182QB42_9DIPT